MKGDLHMKKNSAHDDITLLISDEEIKKLKESAKGQSDATYEHMCHVIDAVKEFDDASLSGPEPIREIEATYTHNELPVTMELSTRSQIERDWIQNFDVHKEFKEVLTEEDLQCLANGDFTVKVLEPKTKNNMTLVELLTKMELFKLGRPSTYSSIIDEIGKNDFVDFSHDCVRLTNKGLICSIALDESLLHLTTPSLSLQLGNELERMSSGFNSPVKTLLKYVELVDGKEQADQVSDKLWTKISDISLPSKDTK